PVEVPPARRSVGERPGDARRPGHEHRRGVAHPERDEELLDLVDEMPRGDPPAVGDRARTDPREVAPELVARVASLLRERVRHEAPRVVVALLPVREDAPVAALQHRHRVGREPVRGTAVVERRGGEQPLGLDARDRAARPRGRHAERAEQRDEVGHRDRAEVSRVQPDDGAQQGRRAPRPRVEVVEDHAAPPARPSTSTSASRTASTPTRTSSKVVESGDRPRRRPSGRRKSGMTPRSHSSGSVASNAAWSTVTWLPRRAGSRGDAYRAPSGSRRSSTRAVACSVSATDLARTAAVPAASTRSSMSCIASIPTIAGVPDRKRRTPSCGAYAGPISNGAALPIQPWIGWVSTSWRSARTYPNAGAPGPPFRYL